MKMIFKKGLSENFKTFIASTTIILTTGGIIWGITLMNAYQLEYRERWESEYVAMTQEEKSCVKEMTIEIFQMMQAGGGGGGGGGSLFATGPAGPKGSVTGEEFRQAQRLAVEQCTPLREFQYSNLNGWGKNWKMVFF